MKLFNSLPKVVRDLVIFNSFIFMVQFIATYIFKNGFNVDMRTLMAANAGILLINIFLDSMKKAREDRQNKGK